MPKRELSALISLNIAGLYTYKDKTKVEHLRLMALEENVNIIAVTESHLNESVESAEVAITGFQLYRADRVAGTKKGGVAVYIKDTLSRTTIDVGALSAGIVECQMLYITAWRVLLVVIYRPECDPMDFYNALSRASAAIEARGAPTPNVLFVGDFNFPNIDWDLGTVKGASKSMHEKNQAQALLQFMEDQCLAQVITQPTRGDNILDLLLTNNEDMLHQMEVRDTLMSDHRVIKVTLWCKDPSLTTEREPGGFKALNFHGEVNWSAINQQLSEVPWEDMLYGKTVFEMLEIIKGTLLTASERYVAPRSLKRKVQIPRARRILWRKRRRYQGKMTPDMPAHQRLVIRRKMESIERQIGEGIKEDLQKEEERAIKSIKKNPKYFYSYAKRKTTTRAAVGPLVSGAETVTDPRAIGDIMQDQYKKSFSHPDGPLPAFPDDERGDMLFSFTRANIEQAMGQLRDHSASGPDNVPAVLLRNCKNALSLPLYILWKKSLLSGDIPSELKEGLVTPLFKSGDRSDPENYRPVTLTSHIIKIFERVICREVLMYLETTEKLPKNQHGFRSGKSCVSQLLQYKQWLLDGLTNGSDLDVIYIDFAKAFDKVDHRLLLEKTRRIGIGGKLLKWLTGFLEGRTQTVVVEGVHSKVTAVRSGVPQGTVLGPVLFLVYLSDIEGVVESSLVSSFADDTRLLREIKDTDDQMRLQGDLNNVYDWANRHKMVLNADKFSLMTYKGNIEATMETPYKAQGGEPIEKKSNVKDLGVVMEDTLGFDLQIDGMVKKARRKMGWLLRVFRTREAAALLPIYKSLVLPHLEYACQLWCPADLATIRKLEAVQRTFTSRLSKMNNFNYWQRLEMLSIYSIERRRERYIIIYVWKMVEGMVPMIRGLDGSELQVVHSARRGRLIRIPALRRVAPRLSTKLEASFMTLGPRLFNCLPRELRKENFTLSTFKRKLDLALSQIPDRPVLPHYHQVSRSNSLIEQVGHAIQL